MSFLGWTWPSWADNLFWAMGAFVLLLVTNIYRTFPAALVIFVLGLVFAVVVYHH